MTKLKYWYQTQNIAERKRFRQHMCNMTGIDGRTVLRYLEETHAPKLTKYVISDYTKIPPEDLYKPIINN